MSDQVFGPDFYHLNFSNDGPLPLDRILADPRIGFVILKFTQGTSYGSGAAWARREGARVRASRAALGGYGMLDGEAGPGEGQADYFLEQYDPQPGDIVPIHDFEASGRKSASIDEYRKIGEAAIARIHSHGFEAAIYGHADVKAAWPDDWRRSGANYWWVPGDSAHADIGPRGPDLWQYGPYTAPAGYPTDPAGIGRTDISVVLTALPIIGGADQMYADFKTGWRYAKDNPKATTPPAGSNDDFTFGFNARRFAEQSSGKTGPPGPPGPKGDPGPAGPPGKLPKRAKATVSFT